MVPMYSSDLLLHNQIYWLKITSIFCVTIYQGQKSGSAEQGGSSSSGSHEMERRQLGLQPS